MPEVSKVTSKSPRWAVLGSGLVKKTENILIPKLHNSKASLSFGGLVGANDPLCF